MAVINVIFATILLQIACYPTIAKELLSELDSLGFGLYKKSDPKQCADDSRLALELCAQKVAQSKRDLSACAKIFIKTFPACFYSKPLTTGESCVKTCWISFGSCAMECKTFANQFICIIGRNQCLAQCKISKRRREEQALLRRELQKLIREEGSNLDRAIEPTFQGGQSVNTAKRSFNDFHKVLRNVIYHLIRKEKSPNSISSISKRGACLTTCMGLYEACLSNSKVSNEGDYGVCLVARTECERPC